MSRKTLYIQIAVSLTALSFVELFALWWFNPQNIPHNFTDWATIFDIILYLLVSYVIWHPIFMEVLTWILSSNIQPEKEHTPPEGLRVAFITTIVPTNESLDLLHRCLPAMVNADYKHDTWILDEENSEQVKNICKRYGVKHFSRKGKEHYNTHEGKFAAKTKGGNHNSWYDVHGKDYDIVAQIDTDFVPERTFLTKTLGYFNDPRIAFVVTPQVYGNTHDSIIAKGADDQQRTYYGSVMRGLNGMDSTIMIGANHIIRVAALADVDYYSAHITEDLLTGMKLHANKWKSIYLPTPLAVGEGPTTWEAYFNQQMRWAYGCIDILFHHSPNLLKKMNLRRALYYFCLQQHYFSGIAMGLSILLISLYFAFGLQAANVNFVTFFTFYPIILLVCWFMSLWLQRYDKRTIFDDELLLAGKIISISAWPIYFLAFISVLRGKRLTYKVTPKGDHGYSGSSSLSIFVPHLIFGLVAVLGLLSSFFTHRQSIDMMIWATSTAILMLFVPFTQDLHHRYSKTKKWIKDHLTHAHSTSKYVAYTPHHKKKSFIDTIIPHPMKDTVSTLSDLIFIALAVLLSFTGYVNRLGFYSDDWSFLGNFSLAADKSISGLIKVATTPNTFMRPGQNILDALLYYFFGLQPLGYHMFNGAVLITMAIFFYLALKKLGMPRVIAFSTSLIFALLPNYSADRFWYASFQANVSMSLYFVSLYAGLRSLSIKTNNTVIWKVISICALFGSVLSYEVVVPLFFFNLVLFWNPFSKIKPNDAQETMLVRKKTMFITFTVIALFYIIIFKATTSIRLDSSTNAFSYIQQIIHTTVSAFATNYGVWLIKLPSIWYTIFTQYANKPIIISGAVLGICIFGYLYRMLLLKDDAIFPNISWMKYVTVFSFILFLLGYSIFYTNQNVGFSPTGIENRVAIAASIGFAFSIIGIAGLLSHLIPSEKGSRLFFSTVITILCVSGYLIINTLSLFWIASSQEGQHILSDIRSYYKTLPKGTVIILDGVCPYIGPGIVYESQWDLKGALQTIYHDPTIAADIVTPALKIESDGLATSIYRFPSQYQYSQIQIYNYKTKKSYSIINEQAARAYFETHNPDFTSGCPSSKTGSGVSIFN